MSVPPGSLMKTADLDYDLPPDLIAQHPCERRDEARMLVLDRRRQTIQPDVFRNIASYLRRGDCLVLNDTRVIRARLRGRKPTGGQVEIFLLRQVAPLVWDALVRPSARVKPGTRVILGEGIDILVGDVLSGGHRTVMFAEPISLDALDKVGETPLPPYIRRRHPDGQDAERYQTIYARTAGAVAAPTAGLHYTNAVFDSLERAGVRKAWLTLHVGYGTFRPIQADRVEDHVLDPEWFEFSRETADILNRTRAAGGRVVAVGTTCTRVLETQFREGAFQPGRGLADRYIYPPYVFHAVDALQTNFHLPRSSLLALVCAFAGHDFIMEAYRFAIQERFRFYSYGDTMLIL